MFSKLAEFINPLHTIAKELTAIRELYEAELATRDKPIYRITEDPQEGDTVVMYTGDEPKAKSALRRLLEGLGDEAEEP